MAALVAAIHVLPACPSAAAPSRTAGVRVDGRDKPVHDGEWRFVHVLVSLPVARHLPLRHHRSMGGYVYMLTNRPNGTLYVGVTADLAERIHQHREGRGSVFTRRYGLKRLVWYEPLDDIRSAIQRESTMKHWPRAWKVRLILALNPTWDDLYPGLI